MVGLGRSWQTEGTRKPSFPGVGTICPPWAPAGLLRVTCLPPGLFRETERSQSQAVSLESAAQGFQKQHTTLSSSDSPSGHKEVSFCRESRGLRPSLRGRRKGLCCSAPRPCPHRAFTGARAMRTLTSSRCRRLALRCAPGFPTFSSHPWSCGEDSERRFGEGGIPPGAVRPSDPGSRFSQTPPL